MWNLLGDLKLSTVIRRGSGVLIGLLGSFSDLSLPFCLSSLQFAFPLHAMCIYFKGSRQGHQDTTKSPEQ